MANSEKNKQFQETEAKLETTYLELRKTLPIEKISVSRLCKEVGINRSSFYYHYLDVYDLNDKIFEKLTAQLSQKMREIGDVFLSPEKLTRYFEHLKAEADSYRLMTAVQVSFPIERSYNQFEEFLLTKEKYQQLSSEELKLSIISVQAGFHFMVRQWLLDDCSLPIEQLVALFFNGLE